MCEKFITTSITALAILKLQETNRPRNGAPTKKYYF